VLTDGLQSGHCTGKTAASDCPYSMYRTSGDIAPLFHVMLENLGSTPPFSDLSVPRSRPGGWSYADMLEVGSLANASEDRTHFGAWAIASMPLILSFNWSDPVRMDRAWPIITNYEVLRANQAWEGHPGTRLTAMQPGPVEATPWQAWAKPLGGGGAFALLLFSTSAGETQISLPLMNVSSRPCWAGLQAYWKPSTSLCIRNLYTHKEQLASVLAAGSISVTLETHDSAMYCVRPAADQLGGSCANAPPCLPKAAAAKRASTIKTEDGGASAKHPLRLSNVFQDHCVLQRMKEIPVFGFGALDLGPGELTVKLGAAPAVIATVDGGASGEWSATLPPQPPSAPGAGLTLTLSKAGSVVQTVRDVAIGELLLFTGQSNIDIPQGELKSDGHVSCFVAAAAAADFSRRRSLRESIVRTQDHAGLQRLGSTQLARSAQLRRHQHDRASCGRGVC